jgi:hypothetical protein
MDLIVKPQSARVYQVFAGDSIVGTIVHAITGDWMATGMGDPDGHYEYSTHASLEDAQDEIRTRTQAAVKVANAVRAIRPASRPGRSEPGQPCWDAGYNAALVDVEHVLRALVGRAPEGVGFTAITR